jgi:hypothetical protein
VLSTVVASATASYAQHHRGADHLAAVAATHGYTSAFTIAAILFGVGAVITTLIMPSRPVHQARLQDHQSQLSSPVPAHG